MLHPAMLLKSAMVRVVVQTMHRCSAPGSRAFTSKLQTTTLPPRTNLGLLDLLQAGGLLSGHGCTRCKLLHTLRHAARQKQRVAGGRGWRQRWPWRPPMPRPPPRGLRHLACTTEELPSMVQDAAKARSCGASGLRLHTYLRATRARSSRPDAGVPRRLGLPLAPQCTPLARPFPCWRRAALRPRRSGPPCNPGH